MERPDAAQRYLARYGEPEWELASGLPEFQSCLIVPACGEEERLPALLSSISEHSELLLILVVNARANAEAWVHEENLRVMQLVRDLGPQRTLSSAASLVDTRWGSILLLERTPNTLPIPADEGVGLCRKLGADIGLGLWARGKLASPWLHFTDADAVLPQSYFKEPRGESVAYLHTFSHSPEPGFERAIEGYEAFLQSYVAGLAEAGSPYAFHSIGSTIEVRCDAYAKVRGVPRRQAGEDFYLLNKLAKLGNIEQGSGAPIRLSGRPSTRVPFGTGQGVRQRGAGLGSRYDPRCFRVLDACLRSLEAGPQHLRSCFGAAVGDLAPAELALAWLRESGAEGVAARTERTTTSRQAYLRRVHETFDGFAAMKLIRHLSQTVFPQLALRPEELPGISSSDASWRLRCRHRGLGSAFVMPQSSSPS